MHSLLRSCYSISNRSRSGLGPSLLCLREPSTDLLDSRYDANMLCLVFSTVVLCTTAEHLHFGFVCPEVVQFAQMQLCKLKLCCHTFVSNYTFVNLKHLKCQLWLALGFSAIPLNIAQSDFGLKLLHVRPHLGNTHLNALEQQTEKVYVFLSI